MTGRMPLTQADRIDGYTRLVGLIGWPSGPWPSLTIYNAAFDAMGLNWRYVPLPVPKGRLREALLGLRALGFAGAKVTKPHRCNVVDHLEELSPAAEIIGAVNFIQVDERGSLVGDNTQWRSFVGELRTAVPSLNGLRPLIIGAGDAARGVVYALAREGLPITIVNRTLDRAINMVHRLRHVLDEHSFSVYRWPHDLARAAADANLIINTTSIGMWPDVGNSPWPDDLPIPPHAMVYDLAYWPSETRFLRQAQASGAQTVGGLPLLVYEAALAFEKWTGQTPPLEVMFQAAGQALTEEAPRNTPWPTDAFSPAVLT
jgi:shikimate dehydrogenase